VLLLAQFFHCEQTQLNIVLKTSSLELQLLNQFQTQASTIFPSLFSRERLLEREGAVARTDYVNARPVVAKIQAQLDARLAPLRASWPFSRATTRSVD